MKDIDISKMNKAEVLAALYNNSKPLGMGYLHYDPTPMTKEEAEEMLKEQTFFDYVKGRLMKINMDGDILSTRSYDRDNGEGTARRALSHLL